MNIPGTASPYGPSLWHDTQTGRIPWLSIRNMRSGVLFKPRSAQRFEPRTLEAAVLDYFKGE
jgi:hypothetical protein